MIDAHIESPRRCGTATVLDYFTGFNDARISVREDAHAEGWRAGYAAAWIAAEEVFNRWAQAAAVEVPTDVIPLTSVPAIARSAPATYDRPPQTAEQIRRRAAWSWRQVENKIMERLSA